jgi:O-antigen/teichoic acid export membrane protein
LISIFISFLLLFYHKKISLNSLNFKRLKEIKNYWKESFLLHFLSPIFDYSDRVLLAFFKNFTDVSIFVSARKIVTPLRQVLQYPQEAMAPEISAKIKNFDEIKIYFEILRKILFLISIHLFFIIILFGKIFILIITNEFYLKAYPVLLILTARIIISSLYSPYLLFYRSYGRIIHFFYSDLLWIISFLLLSYPFIKYLGIIGLALLNLFLSFLVLIFNYFFIFPKYEIISKKEFLKIFKFSISSFLPFSILIFKKFLPPFLILIIYYLLFIILSLIFKPLDKEEWKLFLKKIKKQ